MYAIGIECDGSSTTPRVSPGTATVCATRCSGLGWRLHRIWGTAWYRDRAIEETRLRAAIKEAIEAPLHNRTKRPPTIERPVVETEQADTAVAPTWTTAYRLAPARPLPRWVDPGEPGNHLHMVEPIKSLVETEGPIHLDVAYERLRNWWNIGRIGSNIRANIELAINRADVTRDGEFSSRTEAM